MLRGIQGDSQTHSMNPSKQLGDYFTDRILAPVREWQLEADTNKEFYLGSKEFTYVATVSGHEPLSDSEAIAETRIPRQATDCLLYTSDAADERSSVRLGG